MVTSHRAISELHPSKNLRPENNLLIVGDGMAGELVSWSRSSFNKSLDSRRHARGIGIQKSLRFLDSGSR
jgi:hypothetical protein